MHVNCYTCGNKTDNVKLKRMNGVDELVCLNCIHTRGDYNGKQSIKPNKNTSADSVPKK